jgi:hypothetical protein
MLQNIVAQTDYIMFRPDDPYMINMQRGIMGTEYSSPAAANEGYQFFNDWANGEILLTNGEIITGLRLRYEKYIDQLLLLRNDFFTCVICKTCIKGFNLYDDNNNIIASFVLKKGIRMPLENDSANCFFQTLVKGEYCFYAFRKVSRLPDVLELVDDTRYYIFNNDQYEKVRLSMRDLLDVPFLNKIKMKSILKSNKIRVRDNEQEFIRAICLYNSSYQ